MWLTQVSRTNRPDRTGIHSISARAGWPRMVPLPAHRPVSAVSIASSALEGGAWVWADAVTQAAANRAAAIGRIGTSGE